MFEFVSKNVLLVLIVGAENQYMFNCFQCKRVWTVWAYQRLHSLDAKKMCIERYMACMELCE